MQVLKKNVNNYNVSTSLPTATPWIAEPKNEQWWLDRHQSYKQNTAINRGNISVIFYGDSITEGWGGAGKAIYDSKYAPLGTVNYGVSADRTEHVLYRIADGEVENLNPKFVVLKIGTNNVGQGTGDTNDEIVRGIKAVVDLLLERLPNSKILLLGVLPRNDATQFTRVADINIKISKFHDGNRVHFLDMFDQFATGWGVVDASLFNGDQLHLVTPGYQRWADTMDHLFNELYRGS